MRTRLLTFLSILLVSTGCLRKEYAEAEVSLAVNGLETLTVGAEVLGEDNVFNDVVEAPFTVRANRSWSAVIEYDDEDDGWLSLSEDESLNLEAFTKEQTVNVQAGRNKSTQPRNARIIISEDSEHVMTLPVVQQGQTRFLSAVPNRDKALAILDTVKVSVACNTVWTAEVDASSTADVKVLVTGDEGADTAEGEDYGILSVCFGENESAESEMEAVVKLTAEGCEPCEVRLSQAKGQPYVAFRTDDNTVIPTTSESFEINYASNTHWYMAVEEENNFPGCVVSPSEGDATSFGTVTLTYDFGKDPGVQKSVRLKMWADGIDPVYLTLTQYGCLHIDLMNLADEKTLYRWHYEPNYETDRPIDSNLHTAWWYNPDYDYETKQKIGAPWPFASPTWDGFPVGSAASLKDGVYDFVTPEGYTFKIKTAGTTGIWFHWHQQGFLVGSAKNDTWLEFPVIEGKKLTTIIYEPSYTGGVTTSGLRDENGTAVKADLTVNHKGEITELKNQTTWKSEKCNGGNQVTEEHMYSCTFKPLDTQPGQILRQTLIYAGNMSVKEYTLIYE